MEVVSGTARTGPRGESEDRDTMKEENIKRYIRLVEEGLPVFDPNGKGLDTCGFGMM